MDNENAERMVEETTMDERWWLDPGHVSDYIAGLLTLVIIYELVRRPNER